MRTVLIIEKPNQCIECPCYRQAHEDGKEKLIEWCNANDMRLTWQEVVKVPDWCPLKPLPKEEDIYEVGMDEEDTRAKQQWNKGWNACLEEIDE